jgi:hypothetical protein
MSFAYALLALNLLATRQVPPGSQLSIRLTDPVGTYASRAGDPLNAVLIAPLLSGAEVILPAGSLLSGNLKSVQRVGLGFIHELSALDLEFTRITLPHGQNLTLSSRVQAVDNGREIVTRQGSIRGARTTGSLSYRAGGYIRTALLWEVHAAIAVWAIKTLLVQVPEPELYYPTGVELTLVLTQPLTTGASVSAPATTSQLSEDESSKMSAVVAQMPTRTYAAISNRPSDLVNVMFVGSRDDLATAFEAAGWTAPKPATLRSNIRRIRAVADGHGDTTAPMSDLLVDAAKPEMSWQKGFNDVAKRHHIRIWKQPATWKGREIWIGAATRDIDFAFLRPGRAMTHKIAEYVDDERDKVVNDLVFTSCAELMDKSERPDVPSFTRNSTGDPMRTDGRIAIVQVNACDAPANPLAGPSAALPLHGSKMQRFARREILSLRSDILRENLYWRSFESLRWMVTAYRRRGGRADQIDSEQVPADKMGPINSRSSFVKDIFR